MSGDWQKRCETAERELAEVEALLKSTLDKIGELIPRDYEQDDVHDDAAVIREVYEVLWDVPYPYWVITYARRGGVYSDDFRSLDEALDILNEGLNSGNFAPLSIHGPTDQLLQGTELGTELVRRAIKKGQQDA